MKSLCILGSTGSIGRSTLDVVSRHADRYRVFALTAHHNVDLLFQQCIRFVPDFAVLGDPQRADALRTRLAQSPASHTQVLSGAGALQQVAGHDQVDVVMAAIVGAAGLLPTLAAATAGKRVLLANKEALVMSGELFMRAVREHGAELLPIDSEHNAIFQCMPSGSRTGEAASGVRKIILTASGGPFLGWSREQLSEVTPEQACAHPNWSMGRKISVDSATLMNKGLEVIEASWLFRVGSPQIQVVVHPQSIIHSMVDYVDGSVLAQLGNPDMRTPIAHALAWPERIDSGVSPLDLVANNRFDFQAPDLEHFPCLRLAYDALDAGGTAPTVLNAANEVAVDAFLQQRIKFLQIPVVIEQCLTRHDLPQGHTLEVVLHADHTARELANTCMARL